MKKNCENWPSRSWDTVIGLQWICKKVNKIKKKEINAIKTYSPPGGMLSWVNRAINQWLDRNSLVIHDDILNIVYIKAEFSVCFKHFFNWTHKEIHVKDIYVTFIRFLSFAIFKNCLTKMDELIVFKMTNKFYFISLYRVFRTIIFQI